jgi:hypothetical protein
VCPPRSCPTSRASCATARPAPPPGLDRLRALIEGLARSPLPADLRGELRAYQREEPRWLLFLGAAGLGGARTIWGLGKTVQASPHCGAYAGRGADQPARQLAGRDCALPARLSASVYHGAGRSLDADAAVTLTTYAILRRDRDPLAAVEDSLVSTRRRPRIPESQVAQAACAAQRPAHHLTGTTRSRIASTSSGVRCTS